jgi:hypothetical protein
MRSTSAAGIVKEEAQNALEAGRSFLLLSGFQTYTLETGKTGRALCHGYSN